MVMVATEPVLQYLQLGNERMLMLVLLKALGT